MACKGNASEKDIGHGTLMISGLDSSVLNEELKHIFGFYGEIKEVSCLLLVFTLFSACALKKMTWASLIIVSLIADL